MILGIFVFKQISWASSATESLAPPTIFDHKNPSSAEHQEDAGAIEPRVDDEDEFGFGLFIR